MIRRLAAAAILAALLLTPFFNWRLGAVLWLCAWFVYLVQITIGNRG